MLLMMHKELLRLLRRKRMPLRINGMIAIDQHYHLQHRKLSKLHFSIGLLSNPHQYLPSREGKVFVLLETVNNWLKEYFTGATKLIAVPRGIISIPRNRIILGSYNYYYYFKLSKQTITKFAFVSLANSVPANLGII